MNGFTLSGPVWFDALPEPVVLVRDGVVDYCNRCAAERGVVVGEAVPEALAEVDVGVGTASWQGERWNCRCEVVDGALLFQLHQAEEEGITLDRLNQLASKLRRPLGNLIGALDLLDDESDEQRREQYNAIGKKSYYTMMRMVENMELLGALESAPSLPEVLDFGVLCANVVRQVDYLAQEAERALVLEPWEGKMRVKGEGPWLRKLLYQLINNALRAAGIGGSVKLHLEKRGKFVRLFISDSGGGYSTAELMRAFDPGQANQSMNNPGAGMGLGISICRSIAERCGGRLILLSGNGGKTVVELPLYEGKETPRDESMDSFADFGGGMNEALTQLSDVLPWKCFVGVD